MAEEDAFNKPLDLSDELADVVGAKKLSRPKVTKRIWEHIKENDLQKDEDKRVILADAKLRPVFEEDEVSMFEMTSLLSDHMTDPDD